MFRRTSRWQGSAQCASMWWAKSLNRVRTTSVPSTPLNAVFAAGGVTARGSLRALKHYRGKQLVQDVDAYSLLLHGVRSDVAATPKWRYADGASRRTASDHRGNGPATRNLRIVERSFFGLTPFNWPAAFCPPPHSGMSRCSAWKPTKSEPCCLWIFPRRMAIPASIKNWKASRFKAATRFTSSRSPPITRIPSICKATCSVPDATRSKQGMKLGDLISSYSDLLPEPAPHYGEIIRLNAPDFRPSVESFDLSSALANPAAGPTLKPLDTVRVFSRYDFEPPPDVWVGGEVHSPGKYRTAGQAHLLDALQLAGGITQDASLDSAQLFRTQSDGTLEIMSVDLQKALAGDPVDNILLQPRDRVLVHRNVARVEPPTVYIKGEVAKPGRYPFAPNMRVEDLVRVGGGLKRSADTQSADLTRFAANSPGGTNERLEVKLSAALSGDANEDVTLRNGDVLTIRQVPQWNDLGASVVVRGEVQHPAPYGIQPGEKLSSVLRRCGGFTAQAYPYGAVLLRRDVRELQMTFSSRIDPASQSRTDLSEIST